MANVVDRQITLDGYKNAVVKWTGVLDTSDVSIVPALALSELLGNDPSATLVGLRLVFAEWSMGNGIEVVMSWDGMNPQQILPLAGRGRVAASSYGGFSPDMTRMGYNGSINLTTNGFIPSVPQTFTIVLEFNKMYRG